MTNTKFRKRALLSAVAMLLVALVALGSATFAWFTTNPTSTAKGVKVNTTTAAGLVAKSASDTRGFSHDTILNFDAASYEADHTVVQTLATSTNIQPASFDPEIVSSTGGLTFKNIKAAGTGATYGRDTSASWQGGAAWSEQVFLKTTDNSDGNAIKLGSVKVDIDEASGSSANAALAGCVRVAVTSSAGKLLGVWQANGASKGTRSAFTYYSENASATNNIYDQYTFLADGATATLAAADQLSVTSSTTDNYVTVYVYLDGEDENCYSNNVVNAGELLGTNGINVTFTAA